jgi:hypothetical protein
LDFETGTASQAGNLRVSLEGSGPRDRGWDVAQTSKLFFGTAILPAQPAAGGVIDSL